MHINKKSISESIEDSMRNNKPNVKRMRASNPQSVVNPVMDDALKSSEEFDKNSEKVFTDLSKKSKDITPKEPTTGKKVNRKPYTEGFKLDESLFDDSYDESLNGTTNMNNNLEEDWSKGLSFTFKISTNSLQDACKNGSVSVGGQNKTDLSSMYGSTSLRFKIVDKPYSWANDGYIKVDRNESELHVNLYDKDFTYKDIGGKSNFNKAKLTQEMEELKNSIENDLKDAGLVITQSKVEVGGSPKFNSTWRQAQRYNEDFTINKNAPASRQLLDYAKMRENQDGNGFAVLRNFVEYGSDRIGAPFENHVRKYINDMSEFPDGLWGDLMSEDLDLSNDKDFDTYSNFNSDLYNAMADVVYDYSSKGISKKDIEKAVEWFLTHFFDDYDEDKLEENKHIQKAKSYTSAKSKSPLSESRWDDYDDAEELDEETVYDFIDERLFGVSYTGRINGGNYRATNKFCSDVWMNLTRPGGSTKKTFFYPDHFDGAIDDESRESSTESRRAPTSDGIAVYLRNESEGNLAKAVADELELNYKVKKIGSYNKTNYKYIATIVIPDYIAEMPIDEYLPTIGKSITDYKKPRKTSKATKRELVTV